MTKSSMQRSIKNIAKLLFIEIKRFASSCQPIDSRFPGEPTRLNRCGDSGPRDRIGQAGGVSSQSDRNASNETRGPQAAADRNRATRKANRASTDPPYFYEPTMQLIKQPF